MNWVSQGNSYHPPGASQSSLYNPTTPCRVGVSPPTGKLSLHCWPQPPGHGTLSCVPVLVSRETQCLHSPAGWAWAASPWTQRERDGNYLFRFVVGPSIQAPVTKEKQCAPSNPTSLGPKPRERKTSRNTSHRVLPARANFPSCTSLNASPHTAANRAPGPHRCPPLHLLAGTLRSLGGPQCSQSRGHGKKGGSRAWGPS